jgi:hypothetical protein
MYTIASEWKQVININRVASKDGDRYRPIPAIEPDVVFTHNTIAFIVSSTTAKPNWYNGGDLFQAFLVPFGTAGAAQGEKVRVVFNRYIIHRFTTFPSTPDNQYVLSFSPPRYFRDVRLQVWQYIGENQGATLDSLETLAKAELQRSAGIQTSINKLLKRE